MPARSAPACPPDAGGRSNLRAGIPGACAVGLAQVPAASSPCPGPVSSTLGTFEPTPFMMVRGDWPTGGGYSPLDLYGDQSMTLYGPMSPLRSTSAPVTTYTRGYDGRIYAGEGNLDLDAQPARAFPRDLPHSGELLLRAQSQSHASLVVERGQLDRPAVTSSPDQAVLRSQGPAYLWHRREHGSILAKNSGWLGRSQPVGWSRPSLHD